MRRKKLKRNVSIRLYLLALLAHNRYDLFLLLIPYIYQVQIDYRTNKSEYEALTERPHAFGLCYDDEFESIPKHIIPKVRNWNRANFLSFLVENGSPPHVSEGQFENPMKDRIKDWKPLYVNGKCTMCGAVSHECHTNVYGPLCMQAVVTTGSIRKEIRVVSMVPRFLLITTT